jgi:glycosyltransferase involved in cell wall biosynthesis
VLLPAYNAERTLAAALDSILAQTFTDFEVLLVDDGSADTTPAIVAAYRDPRIRYLPNPRNLGLVASLNRGVELARGPLIARMDADDVALPRRLELQRRHLIRHPECSACGSPVIRAPGRCSWIGGWVPRPRVVEPSWAWIPSQLSHPTVMIRTVAARQNLYEPEAVHCEDYELWLRLIHSGHRLMNTRLPLVRLGVSEDSVSRRFRREQLDNTFSVFRRYYPHAPVAHEEFDALLGVGGPRLSVRRRFDLMRAICWPEPLPPVLMAYGLRKAVESWVSHR